MNSTKIKPAQAQRWNVYAGFAEVFNSSNAKAELRGWCCLALVSLAIAGVFALLVAISRVPGIEDLVFFPVDFFGKGLVIHVIFSFVIWYLSVLGALSTVAVYRLGSGSPPGSGMARLALICGYSAAIMLLISGLLDRGEPSLNNYIPVILDPVYYAGLVVVTMGLVLVVVRLLLSALIRVGPLEPLSLGAINASVLFLLAGLCVVLAGMQLLNSPVDAAFFEDLFWGGGHVLQFVNIALMITAWYLLGGLTLEMPLVRPNQINLAQVFLLAAALSAPLFYTFFDAFGLNQTSAFTLLQYAFLPPTIFIAIVGLRTWLKASPIQHDINSMCLIASVAVFGLGGLLGMFVDGADTRTPAHYHGVLGGINLAFMGLFYGFFLPLMGRDVEISRAARYSVWFYAIGQVLHVLGLFLAGGYGAPRKISGGAGIESLGAQIGLYGLGVGALAAVVGGIIFIWIAGIAAMRRIT